MRLAPALAFALAPFAANAIVFTVNGTKVPSMAVPRDVIDSTLPVETWVRNSSR